MRIDGNELNSIHQMGEHQDIADLDEGEDCASVQPLAEPFAWQFSGETVAITSVSGASHVPPHFLRRIGPGPLVYKFGFCETPLVVITDARFQVLLQQSAVQCFTSSRSWQ